jgi:hypothetical protein
MLNTHKDPSNWVIHAKNKTTNLSKKIKIDKDEWAECVDRKVGLSIQTLRVSFAAGPKDTRTTFCRNNLDSG